MSEKRPAGAVGFVIHNGKLLLILRDDKPEIANPNTWAMPGGGVEDGEDLPTAFKREILEELGISPRVILLGVSRKANGFFATFLTDQETAEITLGEGQRYQFFSPEDLDTIELGGAIKVYWERYRNDIAHMIRSGTAPSGRTFELAVWNGQ